MWRTKQLNRAQRILQADVYVQVWKTATSFDPARGKPLTWMLTICRSRALDSLRRQDRAEPTDQIERL
jgi:DNA-directed RNA polymerase specialized sigma24 family protein